MIFTCHIISNGKCQLIHLCVYLIDSTSLLITFLLLVDLSSFIFTCFFWERVLGLALFALFSFAGVFLSDFRSFITFVFRSTLFVLCIVSTFSFLSSLFLFLSFKLYLGSFVPFTFGSLISFSFGSLISFSLVSFVSLVSLLSLTSLFSLISLISLTSLVSLSFDSFDWELFCFCFTLRDLTEDFGFGEGEILGEFFVLEFFFALFFLLLESSFDFFSTGGSSTLFNILLFGSNLIDWVLFSLSLLFTRLHSIANNCYFEFMCRSSIF